MTVEEALANMLRAARDYADSVSPRVRTELVLLRLAIEGQGLLCGPIPIPPRALKPVAASDTVTDMRLEENDGPANPVEEAIWKVLMDEGKRLTCSVIVSAIQARHGGTLPNGMSAKTIEKCLTRLVANGEIKSYRTDPEDGLGRGFGLLLWEEQVAE